MDRTQASRLALVALLLGAALFASAPAALAATAQDHGQEPAQTSDADHAAANDDGTHAVHLDTPTVHGEDAHAVEGHGDGEGHGEEHGGGHGGMPHLPNALTFIKKLTPDSVDAKLDAFLDPIFSLLMATLLAIMFISLSRRLDTRRPGRAQMAAELVLGGLYSLFRTIIGEDARRYTPYLGSLFIFIFCNNLLGMVPLGHSAMSSFANTTFALGVLTFFYVQGIALKENGIGGYLHHLAGSPHTTLDWCLVPLFFPLHVIGELIKPISLSLRLFGNIFGEDTLVATMVLLGAGISFSLSHETWWVPGLPLQFPFYFLGLLSSTIQALVFTLLSTVYIALWLPHGHHDEAHGH